MLVVLCGYPQGEGWNLNLDERGQGNDICICYIFWHHLKLSDELTLVISKSNNDKNSCHGVLVKMGVCSPEAEPG